MTAGRYAPSPTGPLHLGNVRTALLAWLQARLGGARFILRMEDLDLPRVRPDAERQIIDDLQWLGLDWDAGPGTQADCGVYHQSRRTLLYRKALLELFDKGLVYPCYCSRKDIREAASAPHGPLPVYPGICRDRYPSVSPATEAPLNGRLPAWRFRTGNESTGFVDMVRGRISQRLAPDVGDFVLRRSDGLFAYQLAVVVDDIDMGITSVLRGEDLLDSTCRQIALYRALGVQEPEYWHVALMKDEHGRRMAKRDGSESLGSIRNQGMGAADVVGLLAFGCGISTRQSPISVASLLDSIGSVDRFKCLLRG